MKSREPMVFAEARRITEQVNGCRQVVVPDFCAQVKDVVVVASSSRGGSSIFTEILRHSPELLHFKGEINPFLALAGLNYPHSGRSSDRLGASDAGPHNSEKLARFEREMALDVGVSGEVDLRESRMLAKFIDDLRWRISVQWPELDMDHEFLSSEVVSTLEELCRRHGWKEGTFKDSQLFNTLFLGKLRQRYSAINPYYYDLPPNVIEKYCPGVQADYGSPSCCIIEEPPFVPIAPRRYVTAEMVRTMPLILKTPSNVYRLSFLKKIFSHARFRILHLVRNPADSINGLVDGWQYNGFFAHRVQTKLNISGYSDRYPAWGGGWWKYDLPPDWQAWTERPLEYVCGFQWRSAHQEILNYIRQSKTDFLRIKFEDVVGPTGTRREIFSRIVEWLGVEGKEMIAAAVSEDLPPVMATTTMPPRQRRWFKKSAMIKPVLADPSMEILSTAERLGYRLDDEFKR